MYYVVLEGAEPQKFDRYREALDHFKNLVATQPTKKSGVFRLGDDSALHWHFGDFLTSPKPTI